MKYKKYFIITIILIVLISVYGLFILLNKPINLIDNSKDIIYSIVDEEDKKVPYLNLENSELINEDINKFVENNLNDSSNISYKYNKYGNIISLLIRIIEPSTSNAPIIKFKSYNFIINNSKLLSNDELISLSNTDKNNIYVDITNYFINFYNDSEIRNHLKYEEYINYRSKYFDINNDINYFIDNNKLYTYININNGIDYEEYEYIKKNEYRVLVGDING